MRENEAVRRKQAERGSYHPIRPVREEEWESLWADKVNISDEQGEISSLLEWEQPLEGSWKDLRRKADLRRTWDFHGAGSGNRG